MSIENMTPKVAESDRTIRYTEVFEAFIMAWTIAAKSVRIEFMRSLAL